MADDRGAIVDHEFVLKSREDQDDLWILARGSYMCLGLTESQMEASTLCLTPIDSLAIGLQDQKRLLIAHVDSGSESIMLFSGSHDDLLSTFDLLGTSSYIYSIHLVLD